MYKLAVLPGDGAGSEVVTEALKVLDAVSKKYGLKYQINKGLVGGASLDVHGVPVTDEVLNICREADAVLLGAIGGPKWDDFPFDIRPESALLQLRNELGVFTNLRPVKIIEGLINTSPLKPEFLYNVDLVIVRELTGGLYFGKPQFIESIEHGEHAVDTMEYSTSEIERIATAAFEMARTRRRKVTSVDKANILLTSRLWRKTVIKAAEKYPDITLEHMLVDNCAMQLIRNPGQFDVILTENTFGDIISDEAAMLSGSLGMLPSASLGNRGCLFEPVHGSAPDIAGKNIANPIGTINSVALMIRYTFKNEEAALLIEKAVEDVINKGYRTSDIFTEECTLISTSEMGDRIFENILSQ